MSITNFTELKASVVDWINRPNIDVVADDLVRLAESELSRELETREMEASITFDVSTVSHALPVDYLAHLSLNAVGVINNSQINYIAPDVFDEKREMVGGPCNFTIVGEEMLFWPAPSDPVTIRMRYRKTLPALSDTNDTNWLLDKYPDAYLFGALAEASQYVNDTARLQTYVARRDRAISMINKVDKKKITQRRRARPSGAVA